jgi:transcriptional regulator with XRE-family HTH domain
MQKEVAKLLGADPASVRNWEVGRRAVAVRFLPALFAFLGYDPLPELRTWGEGLVRMRMRLGLSRKQLARHAGLDPATVARLEASTSPRGSPVATRLLAVLASVKG